MASARQQTLAQLQRLNGPAESYLQNHLLAASTASSSPLPSAGPSPVSQQGPVSLSAPLGSGSAQVGARLPTSPSANREQVEVAT